MIDKAKRTKRQAAWDRANTIGIYLKFVKTTEQDLIDYLESQPNKSGYIKSLIRADMQRQERTD